MSGQLPSLPVTADDVSDEHYYYVVTFDPRVVHMAHRSTEPFLAGATAVQAPPHLPPIGHAAADELCVTSAHLKVTRTRLRGIYSRATM